MIELTKDYRLLPATKNLIEFFNDLEKELTECETVAEKRVILYAAEIELIMWDKI